MKINRTQLLIAGCVLTLSLLMSMGTVSADDAYTPTTIKDTAVPVDELALLVKPLTKGELEVESAAWLALVQEKSKEVSRADISIKRKNVETRAATEAAEALEKAHEAQTRATEDVNEQGKATEAMEAAQVALEETVAAQERAEQSDDDPQEKKEASKALTTAANAKDNMGISAVAAGQVAKEAATKKGVLLKGATELREERSALIGRTRIVLDELDLKGGDTTEQRLYLRAISNPDLDVSDWDAIKATSTGWFTSEQGGIRWLQNIAKFFGVIIGFWILSIIIGRIADGMMKHTKNLSVLMQHFLSKSIRRLIFIIGFVVALTALEVNTGPIVAAIGAAGFVVAFALQDSLSNLASGIMILLYRPFDVGDVVETGGVSGTVTSLNLVSVGIKTFDNKQVLVPNNSVWHNVIVNATGVKERRVDMVFGIGYDDDMDAAQAVLERIVDEHPKTLGEPAPVVRVNELADFSVNFICRPWVKTEDYWEVYWDVTRRVKEEFDKANISIPFPQQDVHMHQVNPDA